MFDAGDGRLVNGIKHARYTHEAMIDLILTNPAISQNDLAAHFGYSASWISMVITSDSFQAKLQERKAEIIDPVLRGAVEESFRGLLLRSIEIVRSKMAGEVTPQYALDVLKASSKALGYGARTGTQINIGAQSGSLIAVLTHMPKQERVVEGEVLPSAA